MTPEGVTLEPGDLGDVPVVLEFDPASFVLTAMGRMNAGTARGDSRLAERYGEPLLPHLTARQHLLREQLADARSAPARRARASPTRGWGDVADAGRGVEAAVGPGDDPPRITDGIGDADPSRSATTSGCST